MVVSEEDIFSHFEHVVVGFYKQSYVPLSMHIESKPREEQVFELYVRNREDISIRFNQFF